MALLIRDLLSPLVYVAERLSPPALYSLYLDPFYRDPRAPIQSLTVSHLTLLSYATDFIRNNWHATVGLVSSLRITPSFDGIMMADIRVRYRCGSKLLLAPSH